MSEDRCVICGEIVYDAHDLCPTCRKLMKDMPFEVEIILWRPFPRITPGITDKEYLVAIEGGGTDTLRWNGSHWVTENYFIRTDDVIAWTNPPSHYKPGEEDPITDAFKNRHEYVFVWEEDKDE